jgi:hypothetical protein
LCRTTDIIDKLTGTGNEGQNDKTVGDNEHRMQTNKRMNKKRNTQQSIIKRTDISLFHASLSDANGKNPWEKKKNFVLSQNTAVRYDTIYVL